MAITFPVEGQRGNPASAFQIWAGLSFKSWVTRNCSNSTSQCWIFSGVQHCVFLSKSIGWWFTNSFHHLSPGLLFIRPTIFFHDFLLEVAPLFDHSLFYSYEERTQLTSSPHQVIKLVLTWVPCLFAICQIYTERACFLEYHISMKLA